MFERQKGKNQRMHGAAIDYMSKCPHTHGLPPESRSPAGAFQAELSPDESDVAESPERFIGAAKPCGQHRRQAGQLATKLDQRARGSWVHRAATKAAEPAKPRPAGRREALPPSQLPRQWARIARGDGGIGPASAAMLGGCLAQSELPGLDGGEGGTNTGI